MQISTQNTAQSFGQFGHLDGFSFTNYAVVGSSQAAVA